MFHSIVHHHPTCLRACLLAFGWMDGWMDGWIFLLSTAILCCVAMLPRVCRSNNIGTTRIIHSMRHHSTILNICCMCILHNFQRSVLPINEIKRSRPNLLRLPRLSPRSNKMREPVLNSGLDFRFVVANKSAKSSDITSGEE